ncbi:ATP synthase F1 subunit delta [Carnobacterium sp. ISL-102]|uniref:ATP synthase F1 subunit delta n=1 Tax=Carnobacterium sp. ISL-102 TaxID=2819142 RepID=UPI001BEC7864|nr:ATP synthase F1 subunit delta [Carnobacterium sp. ISL-102]MBT2732503.1 F0F1 ATP synthase subunit delta [Carnobacterium sp. ISL-102]
MKLNRNMNSRQLADAFYQDSKEKGLVDVSFDNIMDVRQVLEDIPNLGTILVDRRLDKFKRDHILANLIKEFPINTQSFFHMLYDYDRISDIRDIVNEFEKIYDYKNRTVVAKISTAVELTDEQKARLIDVLKLKLDAKKVLLHTIVDKHVLGGVIIEAESQVYDGSIRSNLETLKKQLIR